MDKRVNRHLSWGEVNRLCLQQAKNSKPRNISIPFKMQKSMPKGLTNQEFKEDSSKKYMEDNRGGR